MSYANDKVKQRLFQKSRGRNSKINDRIWPVFDLVQGLYPCPPSGRSEQNWMSYTDDKVNQILFLQYRGHNTKINDLSWPAFKLVQEYMYIHFSFICKFQEHLIKLKELLWWQAFSHCKSIGPCGCHSNHDFHCIFMKSLCHKSPTRGMLQIRNDWDQPADIWDITGQRCWWTDEGQRLLSLKAPLEPSAQVS